jgi:non-specific serine/threonine protein kinase
LRGSASRPVLEGYALDRVIAETSVAVVYLGTDVALKLPVAVKEYLPQRLARRHSASLVLPLPGETQRFERGLQAFVEEARTLARCEHPSLLRVVRLVQANGTAYRAMPHHAGQRLDEMWRRRGAPPDGTTLRALLEGLLDALQAWQLVGGVHGRVAPDNILVLLDGRPLLMGPGAVEAALAPERGGAASSGARGTPLTDAWPRGPWVDVHAVARVGRFCITGEWPQEGTDAAAEPLRDAMRRLGLAGARLPLDAALVDAIAAATSPEPQLRPQSAAQLREWLAHGPPAFAAVDVPVDVAIDTPVEAARTPAVNGVAASVAPGAGAALHGIVAPSMQTPVDTTARGRVTYPPEDVEAPFALPPDEVVVAHDVGLNGVHVLGRMRGEDDEAATPTPTERDEGQRPVPQLTPELASLAGRLAGQRDAALAEDAEADASFALPGERRSAGGLARRSGLPTWIFPVVAIAVMVALGVVLLIDQQPVRVEGWTPARAVAPKAEEPRSIDMVTPSPSPMAQTPTTPSPMPPPMAQTLPAAPAAATPDATAEPAAPPASATPPTPSPPSLSAAPKEDAPETRPAVATSTPPRVSHAAPVAPAKAARAAPVVASPREACGERTQFSLYRCMKTQCTEGRWWAHPQCVRLRMTDEVE